MTIRGKGAVLIWNGIADGADAEFIEWHVREHMPERVGIPGFLSGRRYTAIDGDPPYFNFYEVATPEVLRSDAYLSRLNDPSPWTRKVVAGFIDVSRTLCHVAAVSGCGMGAFAEVLRFEDAADPAAAAAWARRLAEDPDICAAQLFLREEGPAQITSETKLRRAPDVTWAAVVVAEAASRAGAGRVRAGALGLPALQAAGLGAPAGRGLYQLDYVIRHEDLAPARSQEVHSAEVSS
jgi:hypothetical protein